MEKLTIGTAKVKKRFLSNVDKKRFFTFKEAVIFPDPY
jgi:hypothetical protein